MKEKDEIKESIITVARKTFGKFGYKKTTMDEIAFAARKGKSSLYYYFQSKEEVFQAVDEREAGIIRNSLMDVILSNLEPREKLRKYIQVRMHGISNMVNFSEAIKNEYISHLDFIEMIRKKYDNEEVKMVKSILNEGVEMDLFRIKKAEIAAKAIVISMKGLEIPLFWDVEENESDQRLEVLLDVLFNGINKR